MTSSTTGNAAPDIDPRLRVLLVDDHPDTLSSLCMLLEHKGFAVTTANNAGSAIELASQAKFDVLVSDIGLPDSTGYDVVRAVHRLQSIPAIAFSGYGTEVDIERSRSAGFDRHFTKPVMVNRLIDAIIELVSTRGGELHIG
jgi:two-component system, chemotaxis family, CheB/CheR fusion protein